MKSTHLIIMEKFDNLFLKYDILSKIDYKSFKNEFIQIIYDIELVKISQCTFITQKGSSCTKHKLEGFECCKLHLKKVENVPKTNKKHQCFATLKSSIQCQEETMNDKPINAKNYYCFRHLKRWNEYEVDEKAEKVEEKVEEKVVEKVKEKVVDKVEKKKKKKDIV